MLGLALHLIGDIYAHRTLVTREGVEQAIVDGLMNLEEFDPKKDFIPNVVAGNVRCSKIDEYMKDNIKNKNRFEDDTAFMPKRFLYSKKTCKAFIHNYVQKNSVFNSSYIKTSTADRITLEAFDSYK